MHKMKLVCLGAVICAAVLMVMPGVARATSDYFVYAYFTSANTGGVYRGGNDVDGYGNYLYVNRNGATLDRYTVTITDPSKANQHPDNPDATGPMFPRTLTYDRSWAAASLDTPSIGEIYATENYVYWLTQSNTGIDRLELSSGNITHDLISIPAGLNLSHLAFDESTGTWYASAENRYVYSWDGTQWNYKFTWPSLGGSHGDGLEIVGDNLWVSDMTSDKLLMYEKAATPSGWQIYDKNGDTLRNTADAFSYTGTPAAVEGMGYGPLGHFWVTGFGPLYEIGGGAVQQQITVIPEPITVLAITLSVAGLGGYVRKRRMA